MKRALLSLAVAAAAGAAAPAQDGAASFGVDVAPFTEYVWRGIPLTDGPVVQLGYTLAAKGASFNIWQNVDLDNANERTGAVTEHDYTLGYEFAAGKAKISLAVLYYTFPDLGDPTTEVIAGASFDVPGNPAITLYQDVDDLEGLYVTLGASHGFALGAVGEQTLDIALTLGYGTDKHNAYYGVDTSTFTDVLFTVSSTFKPDESFSITPSVAFASVLDTDIADAFEAKDMKTSRAVLGFTLSYSF